MAHDEPGYAAMTGQVAQARFRPSARYAQRTGWRDLVELKALPATRLDERIKSASAGDAGFRAGRLMAIVPFHLNDE
ncbi:MAG: hypothetical protein Q8L54_11465 [Devosia sp.]|nr:hypothetical protein [Devosia sp.]